MPKALLRQRPNGLRRFKTPTTRLHCRQSGYKNAMPYERERILNEALPKIQKALSLYESELSAKPDLENLPRLIQIDTRFSKLEFDPRYRALLSSQLNGPKADAVIPEKETFQGTASLSSDTESENIPVVSVSQFNPASVIQGLSTAGRLLAFGFQATQKNAELTLETLKLVDLIDNRSENPTEVLAPSTNDSLDLRAAKIGIKAIYSDFISKVASYKGNLFVGAIGKDSELSIWEFKQGFSIHTDRDSPDERTRLNLGIEESTDFTVDPNDFDPAFSPVRKWVLGNMDKTAAAQRDSCCKGRKLVC